MRDEIVIERGVAGLDVAFINRVTEWMRVGGGEVQLTRVLQQLMHEDPYLARKMAKGLLHTVEPPPDVQLPRVVTAEREARAGARAEGRVDWRFFDATTPSRFQLLVEVKIGSKFMEGQLKRYLDDPLLNEADWGGLIALTRDPPHVDRSISQRELWVGTVRWTELVPKLRLARGGRAIDRNSPSVGPPARGF